MYKNMYVLLLLLSFIPVPQRDLFQHFLVIYQMQIYLCFDFSSVLEKNCILMELLPLI